MRIIAGTLGSRKLHPPRNIPARPTTDIAKTALFNILNNQIYFDETKYLDLFSGTGAISFEMYSRGCRDITMVDLSPISVNFQKKAIQELGINAQNLQVIKGDALQYARSTRKTYDLIFAGPPYALSSIDDLPDLIIQHPTILAKDEGWFILETSQKHDFREHPNLVRVRNYGQTHFWIFAHQANKEV